MGEADGSLSAFPLPAMKTSSISNARSSNFWENITRAWMSGKIELLCRRVLNLIQVFTAGFLVGIVTDKDADTPIALGIFGIGLLIDLHDFAKTAALMLSYFVGEPVCQSVCVNECVSRRP